MIGWGSRLQRSGIHLCRTGFVKFLTNIAMSEKSATFNNGCTCPLIGLGTWKSQPGEVAGVIQDAIDVGYRHFDCAYYYDNEKEIGEGLRAALKSGSVERKDLFVTSKLWNTFHRKDLVLPALKESLSNLGLDYLDLYLIHWPLGFKEGTELLPKDDSGEVLFSDTYFTETWQAMEECVDLGLVKSIGLSNFNCNQVKVILDMCRIKPANNQIESHPYLAQTELIQFCHKNGISVTAYRPLGAPGSPKDSSVRLIDDPIVQKLSSKYGKSPAQILLRYQVDRNVIVIPKSVNKERLKSNLDIFDFHLTAEDIKELNDLNCNKRFSPLDFAAGHKDYPF